MCSSDLIWQTQQDIAILKADLPTVGAYEHAQLMAQITKLQKQLAALQQMKYVTS